jgi:hypothetical protein
MDFQLLSQEVSVARRWRAYAIGAGIVLLAVAYGIVQMPGSVFRNNLGIFDQLMISPIMLTLPLIAVLLGCLPLYEAVGHRFASNSRNRIDMREYVALKLIGAIVPSFVTFFAHSFLGFVIAFYVWPLLGNPAIDPGVYGFSAAEAARDGLTNSSYSSLLAAGPLTYGLLYSLWLGVGAATYAGLGVAALVVVPNRLFALALPFLIYFGETVLAALAGSPQAGVMYSLVPFGLQQTPMLEAAAPQLLVLAASVAVWVGLFPRLRFSGRLT